MALNNLGVTVGSMMGATQPNTDPSTNLMDYPVEVRAIIYSNMLQESFKDSLLQDGITRNVSEFSDGARIVIPQLGEVVVSDVSEGSSPTSQRIETSNIELTIQKYKGATTSITDEFKQDSHMAAQIEASMPAKHLRAIAENYEEDLLNQQAKQIAATSKWAAGAYGDGSTVDASCKINGFSHRFLASGSAGQVTLDDFIAAKLVMDKAYLPEQNRILICDPVVEATLNSLVGSYAFSNNQHWEDLLETGFAKNKRFFGNIFGFDIYLSNRLATLGSGDDDLGTFADSQAGTMATPVAGMKANLFMSLADEDTMPLMSAWRKTPGIEGDRDKEARTDYFYSTARWGAGIQRPESLITLASSATAY